MDVSFTNVLEGARQYFQGLPSASAADGPYFQQSVPQERPSSQLQQINHQQQNIHQQQPSNHQQQQSNQQQQQINHHQQQSNYQQQQSNQQQINHQQQQQTYYQQNNDPYSASMAPAAATGSVNHWIQQHSPSEANRPPPRERTPVQRPPSSHSSASSRPPSHSSQYQDVSRQYSSPYPPQGPDLQPTAHMPQASFQFSRPQSRDLLSSHQQQQHNVTNSTYHQPVSPQIPRPSSREQLISTRQSYQHTSSASYSQNQYSYHQSRPNYATPQPQSVTAKSTNSYLPPQVPQASQQQTYYKHSMPSMSMKQTSYQLEGREATIQSNNTQSNGQYQTPTSNEKAYKTTHNLPPIASYRPTKISNSAKSVLPRAKVPSSTSFATSISQPPTHPSTIQHSKVRSDPYSQAPNTHHTMYNPANSQKLNQQVTTVITQTYTNVIMTPSNSTNYNSSSNQNPPMTYQRTKLENVQNMPNSQPIQNMNYPKQNPIDNRTNTVLNMSNTSVIKQRKESPLDLSVKTVRTTADSTENEAAKMKYGQNKLQNVVASHNYPTLDIERSFNQRSQLSTATAPKVEFHPNFNLSSRHSSWNPPRATEDSGQNRISQETPPARASSKYNSKQMVYHQLTPPNSRYPSMPDQYYQTNTQKPNDYNGGTQKLLQTYPYEARELTAKRPGQVESPAIPNKIAKVENWRESINLQIEEKLQSHYKQQIQGQQPSHPQRVQQVQQQHKAIEEPKTVLVNGSYSHVNPNHMYNYPKYSQPNQQAAYSLPNDPYQHIKYSQSYVPSSVNHHYPSYYNAPNKQTQNLYANPAAARPNNSSPSLLNMVKPSAAAGADKRVLSLLRNSIEIKEQKKIEQQKSLDVPISHRTDIQHPSMDVTAPLQPKPGIDRNNISPFTPISVPDPNICKMPPKIITSEEPRIIQDIGLINKAHNDENTVIMHNNANNDYDGLAAFLAARIRTKGELKEVSHTQNANNNAARDARIQAFLEDTIKSPNRPNMLISSSSSLSSTNASPPKLLKERQGAFAPRKRLFSRNEEDIAKHEGPLREKSTLRSSSETSVFDFPDSEDENEMPVLERQTLDAMRKDRRNSLKQSSAPLLSLDADVKIEAFESSSRAPSPDDDIFGSICDKFVEQLKCKPTRRVKRITESKLDIKTEPPELSTDLQLPPPDIKIKIEPVEEGSSAVAKQVNIPKDTNCPLETANSKSDGMEKSNSSLIETILKNDSESDSENKSGSIAKHKHRVKRRILSSSDSNNGVKSTAVEDEKGDNEQKTSHIVEGKSEETTKDKDSSKDETADSKIRSEKPEKVEAEASKTAKESIDSPSKESDLVGGIKPVKKPNFGDGSHFYPGWEEGVYKYKKSLRMPPSLIHLTRPPMRLSTSLPDLDPYPQSPTTSIITDAESTTDNKKLLKKFKSEPVDSDSESTSSFNVFSRKTNYDSEGSSSIKSLPNTRKENSSILDKLLEKCGGRKKRKNKKKDDHTLKIVQKADNIVELLPTPTPGIAVASKSPEKSKGLTSPVINAKSAVLSFRKDTVSNFKDAFINGGNNLLAVHDKFTTIVLSSRTRKETRAMKQRATIKEVFGEDRPASAPPSCVNDMEESQKLFNTPEPFSKNLEEILIKKENVKELILTEEKSNISEKIIQKVQAKEPITIEIKKEIIVEDDDENKKLSDLVIKKDPDTFSETMSLDDDDAGLTGKRKYKYGKMRRKFSSGFDYIRKKKKIKKEETDTSVERKKKRSQPAKAPESIDDIQKEIKTWVLNKGIGETHLHRAARLGYEDITAYCLEKMHCPPGPKDNAGYTPLHEACARGHLEIAKLLLKYGANVHESAKGGIRPLHEAMENGFVEIVRLLLAYGADPVLATYAGSTPLSLATDDNAKTLLKGHLTDRDGECGSPWHFNGPASCFDPEESGYDVLHHTPQENSEAELEDIEIEMSEALLPNLYSLRGDPPTERWILLQDLSNCLKIKSRDALLKQLAPPTSTVQKSNKNLIRELKMSDFLEQAHCCQFLNMGEKINARASKIALVKYTDRVKELLGIEMASITAR
ncbi:unnamed protein product [Ceutorhynchus assimilis]|uniref:BCL-6 corepressor n=1 Tax=Ceutorhynchus assimilis TaxID=467358 RepID=A0A9N9MQL0_9CUCU|nr:unnamed protein product [Ceutorhynchus assimilis]